uniref:G-protein coupled receptors family 1 profile domain-containing protein n=1 Tax=Malurus cyaneus samueli TaxID=2593467 RepID=A0A8C5X0V8_9PASS
MASSGKPLLQGLYATGKKLPCSRKHKKIEILRSDAGFGNSFRRFKSLFLPILYCLVFVFCLLGNSLVLWVLLTRKRLTTMTDICLLNLAASDLLFVVPLPFQAHYASDQWVFGNAMCKIMSGIYYTGFYSSIFFITLMSVDRYIAIVHAVYAMRIRTATCGTIISMILWLVAGLASVPNIMFSQELEIEQAVQCVPTYPPGDNSWKVASQFAANILGLLIPFSILVFCYTQILKNLQKCKNRNKVKAIKMIFIIVIVFFLFWTPYNIALFLDSLQSLHIINDCEASSQIALALQLTETISFIHCCLNPIIYAFAEKFRGYLYTFFRKHVAPHLCKKCPSLYREKLERVSSTFTQSSAEHDISTGL